MDLGKQIRPDLTLWCVPEPHLGSSSGDRHFFVFSLGFVWARDGVHVFWPQR